LARKISERRQQGPAKKRTTNKADESEQGAVEIASQTRETRPNHEYLDTGVRRPIPNGNKAQQEPRPKTGN